ncbi:CgeB family protein [Sulfurospirillum sp.]|uniref:CgeB family protein n=1 Tax=Sulfurospirillum sp. TaxID=2053622 RepID=UPI002FDCF795
MKILYVDLKYDYGIKERGRNIIGQDGFINSLQILGHIVETFYYDDYLSGDLKKLQEDLKNKADRLLPDLIFFSLFQEQFEIETLNYLKSRFTTINWFGDDQWRFDSFTSHYAPYFTYCVTTDKFSITKYKALGQNNIIYSQWAAINNHQIPEFSGYLYDVSFVGGFHPYRKWFIETLQKRGLHVKVFGNGWENGSLSAEAMNRVFANSKINLNLSNSNSFDLRYLLSHWKALPLLMRSKKSASQIKARNFEIPYFNGFQLTDYVPCIEDYFDIGKEIVCYKDVDEAELLIRYYLENNEERENIKNSSHNRSVLEHGYIHRLRMVLDQIQ